MLFETVDKLRRQLRAPRFHDILLMADDNAAVVQTPRLGIFGWYRNSLLLGLPLMQVTSTDEFRAVLAHEFAHLSGAHGKLSAWIYRLRRSWARTFEELERRRRPSLVLGKFIEWFWPRFNAEAFVLSRGQEYEADAAAARMASGAALSQALIRLDVHHRWLTERFWPDVFALARAMPNPPPAVFREMGGDFAGVIQQPEARRWTEQALNLQTNSVDTHPALKERIAALALLDGKVDLSTPVTDIPAGLDAASTLLGPAAAELAAELSEEWAAKIAQSWRQRHEQSAALAAELAQQESAAGDTDTVDSLWARAALMMNDDRDEEARPLVERVVAQEPLHAGGNFALGRMMLQHDEEDGVSHIERAMDADRRFTEAGCSLLHSYFRRSGQPEKLRPLEERYDRYTATLRHAQAERRAVNAKDTLLPAELTAEQIGGVRELCAKFPLIARAHIARKEVHSLREVPLFVVALRIQHPWWKFRSSSTDQKVVAAVVAELPLPGGSIVYSETRKLRQLTKKIRGVSGSLVYERTAADPPTNDSPRAAGDCGTLAEETRSIRSRPARDETRRMRPGADALRPRHACRW